MRLAVAYAAAVLLSLLALALRPFIGARLGADPALVLALPAVVAPAWIGGFGPGALAVLLVMAGRTASAWLSGAGVMDEISVLRALIAVPTALVVCAAFEQVHRARRRAEARAEDAEHAALATERLAAAQQRMQRLVDSSAVAIAFSGGGVITEANDAFLALMGYSRADLQGGRISQATLIPEEERPVYAMARQELDETGRNGPFHARLKRPDGILVDVITSAGRLGDNDYCIFFTDITALTRAENALRTSEQRFRSLVNATASIVWTAGPQREFITDQPSWAEFTGQTREQYLGFGWLEAMHPEDRAGVMAGWEEARRLQQPFRGRSRLWHQPTGGYRRVTARASPVMRDGRIVEWVGMVFDVEEGEQVSEQLREASARLQLLLESTPLGVIEFDGELHITRWAGQAEAIFGWAAGEAVGRHARDLGWALPEEEIGPATLRELLRGERPRASFRIRNRRKDGRVIHAEWSISAVRRPEQPRAAALLALVLDVSEREQALDSLRQADRQKDNFIATLAHELRNPLAPIANGARLLSLKPGDPRTVAWSAAAIERQVRQLTRLLDDLLDVSRISRNTLQLQRQRLRLQEAIDLAVEQVRPFFDAQGHRLELNVEPQPLELLGDLARLTQVFANLLHNAAKYTPEPGLVTLSAGRQGDHLVVSVQDTGLGIPPQEQQRVFEMFSQAHTTLRHAQPGLGIGLALVRGIVEIHGGTVRVDSAGAGQGSRFTVELPALAPADEPAAAQGADDPLAGLAGHRVLVVDDNTDSADSIAALLTQCGSTVRSCYGGQAALDIGPDFQPSVVLMDIGMPGMDGLRAATLMRETAWGRAALLVAMTGYGQPEDRRKALQAGFDHHLTKPVDLDALVRCLG
ncbi:hybrid sensor histidine kinase/response regulator [Ideonella sp. BN130291]|uniref:hybrid sensor histidine kinase/response regulator n=1 Tax=Ideonella sp. BN130291 TaxID=3112940 RepID=UPI002E257AA4|nr:PAS domain S-box protein [Ideonella sp. BN130291]